MFRDIEHNKTNETCESLYFRENVDVKSRGKDAAIGPMAESIDPIDFIDPVQESSSQSLNSLHCDNCNETNQNCTKYVEQGTMTNEAECFCACKHTCKSCWTTYETAVSDGQEIVTLDSNTDPK